MTTEIQLEPEARDFAQATANPPFLFDLGPDLKGQSFPSDLGFAGFRLHHAFQVDRPADQEEFLVFLGASYFRLRGFGQEYGLSARGAALRTGGCRRALHRTGEVARQLRVGRVQRLQALQQHRPGASRPCSLVRLSPLPINP